LFESKFKIDIKRLDEKEKILEFDMIGVHPSIANAIRRIILSEVTTMAVDKVRIYNNTSIMQDEFLSHRLGLIPIRADPTRFSFKEEDPSFVAKAKKKDPTEFDDNPKDTLLFSLKVKMVKKGSSKKKNRDDDDEDMIEVPDGKVLTKHMVWMPLEGQAEQFADDIPRVVDDDILLAKLSPGEQINIVMQVVKGFGGDHAKFQPVATASYRFLPTITLLEEISGERAERLQSSFSPGVIDIVGKKRVAKVLDPRKDTLSRNYFRHEDLKDAVRMGLIKDHFMFTIESTGARSCQSIVEEAIDILGQKCEKFLSEISQLKTDK
jgi:DNA-directed RNA polymerase I and III subunit RPAC1